MTFLLLFFTIIAFGLYMVTRKLDYVFFVFSAALVTVFSFNIAPVLSKSIGDYQNYQAIFYNPNPVGWVWRYERGFLWLNNFFNREGWLFTDFYTFLLLGSLGIMLIAYKNFRTSLTVALTLYVLSNFWIDAVQIRNTVMFALVLLGMSLWRTKSLTRMILLGIITILAYSQQSLGIFYILLIPVIILNDAGILTPKRLASIGGGLTILYLAAFTLFKNALINLAGKFVSIDYATSALNSFSSANRTVEMLIVFTTSIMMYLFALNVNKKVEIKKLPVQWSVMYASFQLQLLTIPLYLASTEFVRILRNEVILFIILLGFLVKNNVKVSNRVMLPTAFVLIIFTYTVTIGRNLWSLDIIPLLQQLINF